MASANRKGRRKRSAGASAGLQSCSARGALRASFGSLRRGVRRRGGGGGGGRRTVGGTRGVGLQAVTHDGHADGGTEHQDGSDEGPVGGHGAAVVVQEPTDGREHG